MKRSSHLEALIALATSEADKNEVSVALNEEEQWLMDTGLVPGDDRLSSSMLWEYYKKASQYHIKQKEFSAFMRARFKRAKEGKNMYYLIDESSLKINKQDMARRIIERLYESKKKKSKEDKETR